MYLAKAPEASIKVHNRQLLFGESRMTGVSACGSPPRKVHSQMFMARRRSVPHAATRAICDCSVAFPQFGPCAVWSMRYPSPGRSAAAASKQSHDLNLPPPLLFPCRLISRSPERLLSLGPQLWPGGNPIVKQPRLTRPAPAPMHRPPRKWAKPRALGKGEHWP